MREQIKNTSASFPDVATRGDLEKVVSNFYDQVLSDPVLSPIFTEIARIDINDHLPRIVSFWQRIVLKNGKYSGQPFEAHRALHSIYPLTVEHFQRWVRLFHATVDCFYRGPTADRLKHVAQGIAGSMSNALLPACHPINHEVRWNEGFDEHA